MRSLAIVYIISTLLLTSCTPLNLTLSEPIEMLSETNTIELPTDYTSGLWGSRLQAISTNLYEKDEEANKALKDLQNINQNVVAIISIEELNIYEPVIGNNNDNFEWLRKNLDGSYDIRGTAFFDYRCNIEDSAIKMIHGHNMLDGTSFSNLPSLLNKTSCSEMPEVKLITSYGIATYQIYSVLSVNKLEEALPLNIAMNIEQITAITKDLLKRSVVSNGSITSLDTLVLNTCWYGESGTERNLRCLVVCSRK